MRTTPILLALAALLVNCATLEPLTADTCGNGVIDKGEDCDGTSKGCGAPTAGVQACRFTCDAKGEGCPAGSSCGDQQICRSPKGVFDLATNAVSANVVTMQPGDFDGDRRTDIIGSPAFGAFGPSRVHYFDKGGAIAETTDLSIPVQLLRVQDLDKDGVDDIGFTIDGLGQGAFGALTGQSDRTFATVLFPAVSFSGTDSAWAPINESPRVALPAASASCAIGLTTGNAFGTQQNLLLSFCERAGGSFAAEYTLPVSFTTADLVGDPHAGVFAHADVGMPSDCGQVMFATNKGTPRVMLASPCDPNSGSWYPPVGGTTDVATPGPLDVSPYVGEVDEIGVDDILIQVAGKIYSLQKGVWTPHADLTALPIASADLDGDGRVDFVFPDHIQLSSPTEFPPDADASSTIPRTISPRDGLRFSQAIIGRFNDDDLPDMLVSYVDQLDVDVLGNAGQGRFTPFTVQSSKVVRAIGAGDFDGDRIDDIAFLQSAGSGADFDGDLYLAFGAATGAPDAPRRVGAVKDAHALAKLRDGHQGLDDLAVIGTAHGPGGDVLSSSVTLVYGSGSRQQVAPLLMVVQAADQIDSGRVWKPATLNLGPLFKPNTLGIVSIATGYSLLSSTVAPETRLWVAAHSDAAVGGLVPFVPVPGPPLNDFVGFDDSKRSSGGGDVGAIAASTTSGDIDYPADPTSATDEIIVLNPVQGGVDVDVVRPQLGQPPARVATIPNAVVSGGDPVALIDVNGDGPPDIVFIVTVANVRKLMVMNGDGKGSFAAPVEISTGEQPLAFAPIATNASQRELAIATSTKVLLGSSVAATREIATGIAAPQLTSITTGDFDGDGVPDIAIADGGSIRILFQEPVNR